MDKYAKKIYAKDELLSALRDFGQEFAFLPPIFSALMHVEKPMQVATSTL